MIPSLKKTQRKRFKETKQIGRRRQPHMTRTKKEIVSAYFLLGLFYLLIKCNNLIGYMQGEI